MGFFKHYAGDTAKAASRSNGRRILTQTCAHLARVPNTARLQPDLRHFAPTIGDAISFLMTRREGMHAGQLAIGRKALGYPNVL